MVKSPTLKKNTELQAQRESRDLAIYNEFEALTADTAQSRMEVNRYLMTKYNIHSCGTLYAIRKRAQEKIKAIQQQERQFQAL